ncbi:MAG TPA: sigma-70 family RNA polymerase sigma factor [Gaiellaceae bacterium]
MRRPQAAVRRELELLYRSRYPDFVRVATAITESNPGGIDAVQEAFTQALSALGRYRHEAPLEAWVWRIVVNAALAQRRGNREVGQPERLEAASKNGTGPDRSGVRTWIANLPERQRLAVFLRYYADLDYRSIAVTLGVEVGTVSATLNAAHTALRSSLTEVPND